jgi:hypothetical protein
MKKYLRLFITINLASFIFLVTSCGPSSTTVTTLHLQDAVATGPINQPPIHLTESRETPAFTISPWFSYNSQKENNAYISGHTPVNANGIFQVDTVFHSNGTVSYHQAVDANIYEYEGKNLAWDIAPFSGGLNLDARLSKAFAIFLGFSYASTNNLETWGSSSGISFIVEKENLAFRFDAGLHVQAIAYDAHTVAIVQTYSSSGTYEYVLFYHDVGKESYWNPFLSLTFNTASKNQLINYFINAGYSFQTLIDFEPQDFDNQYYYWWTPFDDYHREVVEDLRGSSTAGYLNFTPGVYFRLGESSRISAGVRFFIETQLEDATTTTFILPMLQADFMF